MRILKISVEIDGYKKPEQSVVLADNEDVREYIKYNIVSQMNNPVYDGRELFVQVYVIDGATEHALIPLPIARYDLARHYFSDEALMVWSEVYVTPEADGEMSF